MHEYILIAEIAIIDFKCAFDNCEVFHMLCTDAECGLSV
jgi:hypothetical protein